MRRILLGLALILAGGMGCQALPPGLTLPGQAARTGWVHPTPTPASYAGQIQDALEGVRSWVRGVMQCFAPLRMLGLDRETARDCRPKELYRDGQRILKRLKAISPPAEVKGAHEGLIVGLEELLQVIEERQGQSGTTLGQQFQAIGALERMTKALQEISDFIGQADPLQQNMHLGRGVNLGNALEAPKEGEWGVTLREEYFQLIKEAGFDAVRIPIRWSAHAAPTEPYTIDPSFFERVDWAVDQAFSRGLLVVINMHHYEEIMQDPSGHQEQFLALWEQIADHYKGYPADLLFELLNEPHDRLTSGVWNPLLAEAIHTIRQTNPERIIIVGPADWNGISALSRLELPAEDRHLIVTIHYYNPFHFTHQGAEWVSGSGAWLGTTWQGTASEERAIFSDFDLAARWAEAHHRPLYLGEFGAYSKADMHSRALWTQFVARQAEERGMSWAVWEFCAGFGVYDRVRRAWNEPLLEALIPR